MEKPEYISELEASISLGANRAALAKFLERNNIQMTAVAGGRVMRRADFYAAVDRAMCEAGKRRAQQ